jgi:hypothetical protein
MCSNIIGMVVCLQMLRGLACVLGLICLFVGSVLPKLNRLFAEQIVLWDYFYIPSSPHQGRQHKQANSER